MSSEPGDGNLFVKWSRKQRDKRADCLFHIGFCVNLTTYTANYWDMQDITLTNTFPSPVRASYIISRESKASTSFDLQQQVETEPDKLILNLNCSLMTNSNILAKFLSEWSPSDLQTEVCDTWLTVWVISDPAQVW